MVIIGITGTSGAGKNTVVDYLVKEHSFNHYSVSEFLTNILREQNKNIDRDNLANLANKLRKKYGSEYIVKTIIKRALKTNNSIVIESIRNSSEVKFLKTFKNFYLFSIDANPKIRYKRILKRGSEKDKVTYQDFLVSEKKEMKSNNPAKQNISACMQQADFRFLNNGRLEKLHKEVEEALRKIEVK